MEFYAAVIIGCLVFLLLQLNGVMNLPDFAWKIFFKTNIIPVIFNLVFGCFLVYARDSVPDFYPITLFSAFMLGISGQAVFKKFTNMFDPSQNTMVGINKEK
jgi:hypothetical protein